MSELLLYEIIRSILAASSIIEGRFWVLEGYGNDLNSNNLGDNIRDAFGSLDPNVTKYPASFLLPPVEIVDSYSEGWARFRLEQYFLTKVGRNGDGSIKDIDAELNVSNHPIQYDWKDMRETAGSFRRMFNKVLRDQGRLNEIHEITDSRDVVRRVSNVGNDKAAGVVISWELSVNMGCENPDYNGINPLDIQIPQQGDVIHGQHKH